MRSALASATPQRCRPRCRPPRAPCVRRGAPAPTRSMPSAPPRALRPRTCPRPASRGGWPRTFPSADACPANSRKTSSKIVHHVIPCAPQRAAVRCRRGTGPWPKRFGKPPIPDKPSLALWFSRTTCVEISALVIPAKWSRRRNAEPGPDHGRSATASLRSRIDLRYRSGFPGRRAWKCPLLSSRPSDGEAGTLSRDPGLRARRCMQPWVPGLASLARDDKGAASLPCPGALGRDDNSDSGRCR
jgi:hypothetical protein